MAELKTTESLCLPSPCRPLSQQNGKHHDKPTILNLHNDILWWIFYLNADMEDEAEEEDAIAAIDTLRYSSQVCSRWRQVILSFSSLWGQVINLSHLEHHDWRDEVLRRTGRSLLSVLWVKPDVERLSGDIAAEILKRHWDRIRWLELNFTYPHIMDDVNILQFLNIFQRPSEVLEIFRVSFKRGDQTPSPILSPSNFAVVSNLAPALRVFFAPNIKFNLAAPWLANLRFLALNGHVSAYDVIQAIPHMPLLECMRSEHSAIACTGDTLSSLPQITAPSIKQIMLSSYSDMGPYMDFLAHIKPAAGCCLAFSHSGTTPDAKTLTLANEVLYTYSRCYDFRSAIDISLDLGYNHFFVEAQIPRKAQFCFQLRPDGSLRCDVVKALFAALPSGGFQELKVLSLEISEYVFGPANSRITQFILSVSSVEYLTISPETLQFLLNFPSDILAASFPVLHTVEITRYLMKRELSTIRQFLTSRISIGRPIGVLSIPTDLESYTSFDLRSLERFTGLTVIIQYKGEESEHICGNGRIEELLIPHGPQWDSDLSDSDSESSSEGE
ncbi:hypothetical protein GALMADRAFT_414243 [Galerina marginata CBS 339.88]|uniref:F-box domain-containing protein n=1 Tax=Galerina marginata (strain CBS 339.88) TaxID=685588 RepID=A0A067T3W4_GALM3|nr:hypothetical protein GALMADRAFT_414243 [Galerina marginata CBS 339.88]